MNEKSGQRMIESCLAMEIDKCRSQKGPSNCCNWDGSHRTEGKSHRYVSNYYQWENEGSETGNRLRTLIWRRLHSWHPSLDFLCALRMTLRGGIATVNRVAQRSLALQRITRKVRRIRADKRARIRKKVSRSIRKDKEPGRLSYEYGDRNRSCASLSWRIVSSRERSSEGPEVQGCVSSSISVSISGNSGGVTAALSSLPPSLRDLDTTYTQIRRIHKLKNTQLNQSPA